MLKLGFVSAILADFTFEQVVDFAAEHHFACVEMMCWPKGKDNRRYAGVTHVDLEQLTDSRIRQMKDYLRQKNIFISGLGYYPNPLASDKDQAEVFIAHIKQLFKAAARLEVPVVNTFIGRDHTKSLEDNFTAFKNTWPSIVKSAEEANVKIGIENCPMYFTADEWPGGKNMAISPAIWRRMFETIPSPAFGLNYDPSHLIWMQMDEVKPLYEFKDRLHHIHLKDVKVHRDKLNDVGIMAHPLEYFSPKIPGLGDVNWRAFFSALTEVGYRGATCIEVEDKAFEKNKEDMQSAILTARNFLSQFVLTSPPVQHPG